MDTKTNTLNIDFVRDALMNHAGQVKRYVRAGAARLDAVPANRQARDAEIFLQSADALLDQLEMLMQGARGCSVGAQVNLEQLEAEYESMRGETARIRSLLSAA